jgi:para-nitrobenzyl esterase
MPRTTPHSCILTLWLCLLTLTSGCTGDEPAGSEHDAGGGDASTADTAELSITLDDGKLQGDLIAGSRRFLKIPYAKPPLDSLRWRAPEKNEAWRGVRHEADFALPCAQNENAQGPASANEDCLYLNVWAPAERTTKAPVMVWLHGGGNFAGSAGDRVPMPGAKPDEVPLFYDGQFFAARQGVVLVSLNYRLGPLGFFAHPGLADEASPLGNQGLRDQRLALEWVRDNIAAFGGDPANVTIFGESAGSADVCLHVVSPLSRGLFARAISQSGGCAVSINGGRETALEQANAHGVAFAKLLGCDGESDELACLRARPIAELMQHAMQPNPTGGDAAGAIRFGPIVDGDFLPDQPRALFAAGKLAKVPYLLGSNTDEGKLFVLTTAVADAAAYTAALESRFGDSAAAVQAQYPASRFGGSHHDALARAVGDSGLGCGTDATARAAAAAGLEVYVYNFNVPWSLAPLLLGAAHGAEISHVFGAPYMPTDDDARVSDAMNTYWAQFARTGDPNFADSPRDWPRFRPTEAGGDRRLQLDAAFDVLDDFRKDDCAFWRGLYDAATK